MINSHSGLSLKRLAGQIAGASTLICALPSMGQATQLDVPSTYPTIQAAVNAAYNGDVIAVSSAGSPYSGEGNVDIDTLGKAIKIQGTGAMSTVINAGGSAASPHQAFLIHSGETSTTVISGFTIENGYQAAGGAININASSPTISQCIFAANTATASGGAININLGSPVISQCVFIGNQTSNAAGEYGGAIEVGNDTFSDNTFATTVTLVNNVFVANSAGTDGAAVDIVNQDFFGNPVNSLTVKIDNCSFSGNTSSDLGNSKAGGAVSFYGGTTTISNSILYGDTGGHEISANLPPPDGSVVRYSDIQGGYTGTGNINADPLFENAAGSDLRLTAKSPAINDGVFVASSPSVDLLGNARDANLDMGAYEYLIQGSSTTIAPVQQVAFTGQVATFTDTAGEVDTPGTFTASISWGDGTTSAGTVSQSGTGTAYVVTGSHTYSTSGAKTVMVTLTGSNPNGPLVTGKVSALETVSSHAISYFTLSAPSTATAGTAFTATVTAKDTANNTFTGYTGTIHFTSDDPTAVLPADATLTNGTGSFTVTLKMATLTTLRVRDTVTSSITGTAVVTVSAGPAVHLTVTAPATSTAGAAFYTTITARDKYNNAVKTYAGTVHVTSTDNLAVLPADFVLTNGAKQVTVKLIKPGTQSITAVDTVNPVIKGISSLVTVTTTASKFIVTGPSTTTAGVSNAFVITAKDSVGNTVTTYTGTVHFVSTDPAGSVSADITLVNGSRTFNGTFKTAATQKITATDTVNAAITGSVVVLVNPGAGFKFIVTAPASVAVGAPFTSQITALDKYGNLAKTYGGYVHFTSTDPLAVLPANVNLVNGTKQVSIKFKTAGSQTFTATDTVTAAIKGISPAVTVH